MHSRGRLSLVIATACCGGLGVHSAAADSGERGPAADPGKTAPLASRPWVPFGLPIKTEKETGTSTRTGDTVAPPVDKGRAPANKATDNNTKKVAKPRVRLPEQSWRFITAQGVLRVFRPAGYNPRKAGLLIYVHGFYDTADTAWNEHKLEKKFRDSRQNALFIVPEAPTDLDKPVQWPSLAQLISTSLKLTKQARPRGPIVAAAHSGGYLTLLPWLSDRTLHHIILIDGLYGCEPQFHHWLYKSKDRWRNRLILIAQDTLRFTDPMVTRSPGAITLATIPAGYKFFTKKLRRAKLLYMRSQYEHMELVTRDDVIPLLLRISPLKRL